MDKFLNEEDLPKFYQFLNKAQKNATQINNNTQKIDLFTVLDISGSMNVTSNKFMNYGTGFLSFLVGSIISLGRLPLNLHQAQADRAQIQQRLTQVFTTRLDESKKHLILQIQDLQRQQRINKIGLITFNDQAKIAVQLTSDIRKVVKYIREQKATGATALYDSLRYAIQQLKHSSNPRLLIMTDGQDNSSQTNQFSWAKQWFQKQGLKSTFFTICEGDNQRNRQIAQTLNSRYVAAGTQRWFSNSFDEQVIRDGFRNLL